MLQKEVQKLQECRFTFAVRFDQAIASAVRDFERGVLEELLPSSRHEETVDGNVFQIGIGIGIPFKNG